MKLKHSFLIACLSATPLLAQQVQDKKVEVQKTEKAGTAGDGTASASVTVTVDSNGVTKTETHNSDSKTGRQHHRNQPGQAINQSPQQAQNQKPVPYIGVLTREVPPELRSQFSLPEGFGLMVEEVMPDSPAAQAGLKVHDLLLKFEDQRLMSMEQLMLLVRSKHKGDSVSLTVISSGKEAQVPVTLGEHVMPAHQPRTTQQGFAAWPQNGMQNMFNGGDVRTFQNQGAQLNEQMQHFQKEMLEYQRRIQDWARQGNNGAMPQPPMFNNMPGNNPQTRGNQVNGGIQIAPPNPAGGNVQQFNFSEAHAASNITRRDDSGEYTLKHEDGKTTFVARPNNGKEQSWPVNNDTERNAVPQELRDKLHMMDGAGGGGIRIEINPGPNGGGAAPQPQPGPGGVNQPQSTPPRPKKPTTSA